MSIIDPCEPFKFPLHENPIGGKIRKNSGLTLRLRKRTEPVQHGMDLFRDSFENLEGIRLFVSEADECGIDLLLSPEMRTPMEKYLHI